MTYFNIKIYPSNKASSGVLVVDNFHPKWKQAATKLLEGKIKEMMEEYKEKISKWSGVEMNLVFSDEYCLNHINLAYRAGLDLDISREIYSSHNVHTVQEVGALTATITNYIGWMDFILKRIK